MKTKFSRTAACTATAFVISYLLNFVWETLHSAFLYGEEFEAKGYVIIVNYASVMDGLIVLGIYMFVAALWRDLLWLENMRWSHLLASFAAGVAVAAGIEYERVFVLKTWSYGQLMPTIFGIGVSPLAQLGVTAVLSFMLTRRFLFMQPHR
jgi:hypothetical protein